MGMGLGIRDDGSERMKMNAATSQLEPGTPKNVPAANPILGFGEWARPPGNGARATHAVHEQPPQQCGAPPFAPGLMIVEEIPEHPAGEAEAVRPETILVLRGLLV